MKYISKESVRNSIVENAEEFSVSYSMPNEPNGEMHLKATGKSNKNFSIDEMFAKYKGNNPQGEMMSLQDVRAFIQNATVEVAKARTGNPTLYKNIYEEIVNSNFTETVNVKDLIGLQAVFGLVNAGESVPLASWKSGKLETVKMCDYACGYSVLDRWVRFNQSWNVDQANKALGIAYNAILDHIHLSPIITATYTGKAVTNMVTGTQYKDASPLEIIYHTLRKGVKDALARTDNRGFRLRPTIALCNSSTAMDVEAAIKGLMQKGTELGSLGQIQKVIAYDGWEGTIGNESLRFVAPADNEVYLIQPKDTFKALVKTELTQLTQRGDIMRLSNLEVAQFFCRGVVADVEGAVHKVTLTK